MSFADIAQIIAAAIFSYLLGSVPTGYLLVKFRTGNDIRNYGSGNIGATNTLRVLGKCGGAIVLVCDLLKGALAAILGQIIAGQYFAIICGVLAILGHTFPVWLRFNGGKGAATAIGVMIIASPLSAVITIAAWLISLYFTRIVSLSTIVAACMLDLAVLILHYDAHYSIPVLLASILVIYRHKDNIKRLLNGTEYKFDRKVK
ncbi:MAG: glycerol-3-phosphate 1-O-acyltransferase PlsY [Firmicutes bacterium]|nr:glycerol-3-phosphate 1-O-acyltransferase PlsY [Bacillota bacterium]